MLLPLLLLVPLTALGVGILVVWFGGTWFRFARYHRHKGLDAPDGATWAQRLRHWMWESSALVRLFWWKVEAGPRRLIPPDPGVPVLCVHGFTQDRTNFAALRRRLWRSGRPSDAIDMGLPGRHPRRYTPSLTVAIEGLDDAFPDDPIDIVCHSMGGLILRQLLVDRPDVARRIRRIVTLGSPHQGTAAARGPLSVWPEAAGLHRRSAWIAALPDFRALAPHAEVLTVGGTADYVVYPVTTCHLPGSTAVDAEGIGHGGLLTDGEVLDVVEAFLDGVDLPEGDKVRARARSPRPRSEGREPQPPNTSA